MSVCTCNCESCQNARLGPVRRDLANHPIRFALVHHGRVMSAGVTRDSRVVYTHRGASMFDARFFFVIPGDMSYWRHCPPLNAGEIVTFDISVADYL